MIEYEARCPDCRKRLAGVIFLDGTRAIVRTYCKNCKQLKDVLVSRVGDVKAA